MRAPRVPVEEQYRLIMECRKSGLSDHQWCLNNDINPGTFYNWVKRLRKNGCGDIPEKNQLSTYEQSHQEVVKIEMNSISVPTDMNKILISLSDNADTRFLPLYPIISEFSIIVIVSSVAANLIFFAISLSTLIQILCCQQFAYCKG